jgi:hypothetical protein
MKPRYKIEKVKREIVTWDEERATLKCVNCVKYNESKMCHDLY